MSDVKWKNHAKNPAAQPFNLNGRKNKTKQRAWWQLGNNNNPKKTKKKDEA